MTVDEILPGDRRTDKWTTLRVQCKSNNNFPFLPFRYGTLNIKI